MSQPPPAMSWTLVVCIVGIGVLLAWGLAVSNIREAECDQLGGTFLQSRSSTQCIKDGKIIIIWRLGETVRNP